MPYTPEALPTYTFKNGAVATVHRIGAMTIGQIAAGVESRTPAVPIPTFTTDMGAGPTEQPNPADKGYQQAVVARQGKINMAIMDRLIDLAIDIEIDQAALDRLKTGMERIGEPLSEISDTVAYIKHLCVTDGSELAALSTLIRGDIEEAAAAAAATFSSELSGPAAEPLEPASVGRALQLSV